MKGFASLLCPALLITGLVSCGSPGATGSDAATWVDGVCARMTALDREVTAERADLDARVTDGADVNAVLSALERFLGDVGGSVGLAGKDLDRLGLPGIESTSQTQLHGDIGDLFDSAVQETAALESSAQRARRDPSTALDELNSLTSEVRRLTDVDAEMRTILTDYQQLRTAFEDSSTCRRWVSELDRPAATSAPTSTAPSATTTTVLATTTVPATTTTVPPTTVAPTTAPPTTAAPTTVPVTIDPFIAVREQYLVAADEYNPKFDQVWSSFHDSTGFILYKDAPTYCDQVATLEREWSDRMSVIPWPPDAVDEAQAEAAVSVALLDLLDQCAAAPATKAGEDALLTAIEIEHETYYAAVDALRIAIGLPAINGG
jgi:hypothetical protein